MSFFQATRKSAAAAYPNRLGREIIGPPKPRPTVDFAAMEAGDTAKHFQIYLDCVHAKSAGEDLPHPERALLDSIKALEYTPELFESDVAAFKSRDARELLVHDMTADDEDRAALLEFLAARAARRAKRGEAKATRIPLTAEAAARIIDEANARLVTNGKIQTLLNAESAKLITGAGFRHIGHIANECAAFNGRKEMARGMARTLRNFELRNRRLYGDATDRRLSRTWAEIGNSESEPMLPTSQMFVSAPPAMLTEIANG